MRNYAICGRASLHINAKLKHFNIMQGPLAFYKGFIPNFGRLGSWNVIMFLTLEQVQICNLFILISVLANSLFFQCLAFSHIWFINQFPISISILRYYNL
jgi:hypothetical protein